MSKFINGLLILGLLVACSPPVEKSQNFDFPDPTGPVVTGPMTPHTAWSNPITEVNPSVTIDDQQSYVGVVFDGWTDESMENRINEAIQAQINTYVAMTTLQQLPPLRGLYQRLGIGATLEQQYIYAYTTYAQNGVLSVIVQAQFEFKNPDETMVYLHLSEGMTFECIHGNRLNLSDLMVNGSDIAQRLNLAVTEVLDTLNAFEPSSPTEWFFDEVTLIQPFKGLRPTQSFSLNAEGIQLILDHRTPEFDIRTSAQTLSIPYALIIPDLALTQRYADPTVFASPIKQWRLFQTQDPRMKTEQLSLSLNNKTIQLIGTRPANMADPMLQRYDEQKAVLSEALKTHLNGMTDFEVYGGVYTDRSGPYTCINVSYVVVHGVENLADTWVICYDEYSEVITPSDVFRYGFDVEAYFRQLISDEVQQSGYYRDGFDVDEAVANLKVSIHLEGLNLSTWAHAPGFTDPEYVYVFIDYGSIGIENLAILNPTP